MGRGGGGRGVDEGVGVHGEGEGEGEEAKARGMLLPDRWARDVKEWRCAEECPGCVLLSCCRGAGKVHASAERLRPTDCSLLQIDRQQDALEASTAFFGRAIEARVLSAWRAFACLPDTLSRCLLPRQGRRDPDARGRRPLCSN